MRTFLITALLLAAIAGCLAEFEQTAEASPSSCTIIHHVFDPAGEDGAAACRVAKCESGLSRWATNGQYLGLFQLGAWARGRYLHGPWFGSWANARAALALFRDNGHDWRVQWSCAWAA